MRFGNYRPNICLLEALQGDTADCLQGPLVFTSGDGGIDYYVTRDVELFDYRTLLDMCRVRGGGCMDEALRSNIYNEVEYFNQPLFNAMLKQHSSSRYRQGVEIACLGETEKLNAQKYTAVQIRTDTHPIFDTINKIITPSLTTVSMGLPLMIRRRVVPELKGVEMPGRNKWNNDQAALLNLNTNIIREDGKPIFHQQVEALVHFFQDQVYEAMLLNFDAYFMTEDADAGERIRREQIMAEEVTKEKFEAYFEKFKKAKVAAGDESWVNVASPHSV